MPEYNALNERLKKQYEDLLLHDDYREQRTADAVWKAINLFEHYTGRRDFAAVDTEQAKGCEETCTENKMPHSWRRVFSCSSSVFR